MRPILVVDDDAGIRELLRLVLELDGYSVEAVNNGEAALESLTQTDEVRIVLLDINMPRMSGLEVCARLSALRGAAARHLVVLMTAGRFPDGDVPPLVRALLPKPFDLDTLESIITELERVDPDADADPSAALVLDSLDVLEEPRRVA